MRAVDTDIIVRYLTRDDPRQSPRAKVVIETGAVFVSTTVLLETEWVLRSLYDFPPARIAEVLRELAGLPTVAFEESSVAAQALEWFEGGLDFADALHLAKSSHCDAMITFDRAFIRGAARIGGTPVRAP